MQFKFSIQPYQTAAVESVVQVFAGQPRHEHYSYRRDVAAGQFVEPDLFQDEELGFRNAKVQLAPAQLLENIRRVQRENGLHISSALAHSLGACSLDVEMETGTGKTYVYIKTMFELNRRYGWGKFIVVVPSVAIREGVRKSFETMQEHFMEHYGKKARFFVYDSRNLSQIDSFSQSDDIHVMIINIQAFNSSFNEEKNKGGRGGDAAARIIFSKRDDFGSRRPIDVIAANSPIIIMDEPQKMGGDKTQAALRQFRPLFCLNYSATHKQHHDLVYVLDALDAYNQRLVKRIEVKGFEVKNLPGTHGYLYVSEIVLSPKKPPMARVEFEVRGAGGAIRRTTRLVGVDDDIFSLSGEMEEYRGWRVSEVNPFAEKVAFTSGQELRAGEAIGNVVEADLRRVQIRETIRSHFEKERELFGCGIKTLSLFFIDEVAKYRKYDEHGTELNSEYAEMFEQEYTDIFNEYAELLDTPYAEYLRSIDVQHTHAGYFSIDKKSGRRVDSATKRGSDESDDISAYDLILKDKERLLSLDNPVRFIFSHSALREGWDNPNVFQICALKRGSSSPVQKRQEVGRGLRLCVNQGGERMDAAALGEESQVQQLNVLTVVASGSYGEFVKDLQHAIREDLAARPTRATAEYFIGKVLVVEGKEVAVSKEQGKAMYQYLVKNDYIDEDDRVTEKYHADLAAGTLAPLPERCAEIVEGLHLLVRSIFDEKALKNMFNNGRRTKTPENPLNDNFHKAEFQELWQRINHQYTYTVAFDSEELVSKAVGSIDAHLSVTLLKYTVTHGRQEEDLDAAALERGSSFVMEKSKTEVLERAAGTAARYDLVGSIATGAMLTRRTAAKILAGISPKKFALFKSNPEEFIAKATRLINEQKAAMVVEHICYNQSAGSYDSTIFTAVKHENYSNAYRAKKNVQDYVFADGYAKDGNSAERRFAEAMDAGEEVCVYAKLPRGFAIPTPVGNYSPDWAIAFHKGKVKHIFFVAETKGTMETMELRAVEKAKIDCARKLFQQLSSAGVVYDYVDSYQHLLDIVKAP